MPQSPPDQLVARPKRKPPSGSDKKKAQRPSPKRLKALAILANDPSKSVSAAMREAGYAPSTATKPSNLTSTESWRVLLEQYLPDTLLTEKHRKLLLSTRIEHMTFPLGPRDEDHPFLSGAGDKSDADEIEDEEQDEEFVERTTLTDQEIVEMLAEVNCTVKRIVHGNTARHVYFWAQDPKAVKEALDMAYKLKGSYVSEKAPPGDGVNVTNIFYDANIMMATKEYETNLKQLIANEKPPETNEPSVEVEQTS